MFARHGARARRSVGQTFTFNAAYSCGQNAGSTAPVHAMHDIGTSVRIWLMPRHDCTRSQAGINPFITFCIK